MMTDSELEQPEVEETAETEELTTEHPEETVGNEDAPQEVYFDLDGEEVSLTTINEWKSGHMMQSDYTKKTQEAAEIRKAGEAMREEFAPRLKALSELESEVVALIQGDADQAKLDELRQFDTAEYLRVKEDQEKRLQKLQQIRAQRTQINDAAIADEQKSLADLRGWATDPSAQTKETELLKQLVEDKGINRNAFADINDHTIVSALIDAAKYHDLQKRKPGVTKLVKGTPKETTASTTKPAKPKSMADVFYGS